ncbi:hypothetical protein FRC12_017744 [Ceratobasidium sp. 428]|nr:hypothetical protein FRC12_017744 [Ceratobasidium sp. 428]
MKTDLEISPESDAADRIREDRLCERLRKWRINTLLDEEAAQLLFNRNDPHVSDIKHGSSPELNFLRSCVVVPQERDLKRERGARETRRQYLNELRARVALGMAGMVLPPSNFDQTDPMIQQWKIGLVNSNSLSHVIERAVASAPSPSPELEGRILPWKLLSAAWEAYHENRKSHLAWIQNHNSLLPRVDPVVQHVKQMHLTEDERILLRCLVNPDQITSTFDQVHHPASTIDRIHTLVSLPLLFPAPFQTGLLKHYSLGGALLFGPPGTGKTLVAQAIAKQSGARMLATKPSDIIDKCHGHSEKIIQGLFKLARRLTPCLIFMDEIDGLLGTRIYQKESNSGHWHASMLTEFMQEMDGLVSSNVLVIGATNRPFALDEAVLRRLPHRIMIDLPKRRARKEILAILLREEVLAGDVNLREIARATKRFSGSDLRGLCVSAALAAAKEGLNLPWRTNSSQHQTKSNCLTTSLPEDQCETSSGCAVQTLSSCEGEDNVSKETCNISNMLTTPGTTFDSDQTGQSVELCLPDSIKISKGAFNRVIASRHLEIALKENKATACESSRALHELRRWGKQFSGGVPQSEKSNPRNPL